MLTRKFDSYRLPLSVSLAAPAVRILVVHAWANRGPDGEWKASHGLCPVLAVQASVEAYLSRHHKPNDVGWPASVREAVAAGWTHESSGVEHDLVVLDEDGELTGENRPVSASQMLASSNGACRTVYAPWPPTEDESRLAKVIEEVTAMAIRAAEDLERRTSPGEASA